MPVTVQREPAGKRMNAQNWAMLIALSILWGGSFFFAEIVLQALPPFTVVLCRVGLAAPVLILAVRLSGMRMPSAWTAWGAFLTMGALNNVLPFSLIVWGQTEISGGLAAILNATTPLFTVVLAHAFTRDEKLDAGRIAGVAFGFLGVAVTIGPGTLSGFDLRDAAQIFVLVAAASYASAGIYGRRFAGQPPIVTAAGQLTASTIIIAPLALLIDRPWTLAVPGIGIWRAIAALALFSTALAYFLYFRILARAGATNLLLVTFLIPVSAILLGAAFLGESLHVRHYVGLLLVGGGLAAIGAQKPAQCKNRRSDRRF